MEIDHCAFPEDILYEADGLVWVRPVESGDVLVGITSIYAAIVGPIAKVTAKPIGAAYARDVAIGFLESGKYFGPIRSPVRGVLRATNPDVLAKPRIMTNAPYTDGWLARVHATDFDEDRKGLHAASDAKPLLAKQIAELRVRCFAAFPDHEMFEIGVECSAVLTKLNELLQGIRVGDVVHLVTDDPTAPIEMVRWSDETKQPVIDERKEGNLYHFLVRKTT